MEALKRVEFGLLVPDLCCDLSASFATFYKWRPKCGVDTSMMTRLTAL
jgi:putative transposase